MIRVYMLCNGEIVIAKEKTDQTGNQVWEDPAIIRMVPRSSGMEIQLAPLLGIFDGRATIKRVVTGSILMELEMPDLVDAYEKSMVSWRAQRAGLVSATAKDMPSNLSGGNNKGGLEV